MCSGLHPAPHAPQPAIARLQAEYTRLQQRIDAPYEDKLDAKISEEFFARKYQVWREEQQVVLRDIQKHDTPMPPTSKKESNCC